MPPLPVFNRIFAALFVLFLAAGSAFAQTLATPAVTLIGTEINQPGNNNLSQATVGELITYQVEFAIPDNTTVNSIQVVDTFGTGLSFVDINGVTVSAGVTSTIPLTVGGLNSNTTVTGAGATATINLGNVTNANTNPATTETIAITFRAVVLDVLTNRAGTTLGNSALLSYQGTSGTTQTASAAGGNVTIVEPTLALARTVRNVTTSTGPASSVPASNGNVIQYVVTITNPNGTPDTTVYDLALSDPLPAGLGSAAIQSVTGTGTGSITVTGGFLTQAFTIAGGTTLLVAGGFNIDMQKGSTITITVQGTYSPAGSGTIAPDSAGYVTWTSLDGTPGTRSTYNTSSTERTGADGAGTGANNYRTSNPTLSVNDGVVTEGDSGAITLTFTVTQAGASSVPVTVNYATANNTAVAGSDYTATSGTLTFAPGQSTQTVSVSISGDTLFEANETFFLNLTGATNATISDNQGLGTIIDDDAAASVPVVSGNNQIAIVNTAYAAPLVAVVRNAAGNPVQGVSVTFTAPGSGASAVFSNTTNTITATTNASGQASSGTLSANGSTGSYNVTATATGGTSPSTTFSLENQPTPQLAINDATTTEGDSGTKTLIFTVTANPVNNVGTVTVNYATANNTATAGSDYTPTSGTLTFAPGQSTQTMSVSITGDTLFEGNETFFLNLSGATNAVLSDNQAIGIITDDDSAASVPVVSGNNQIAIVNTAYAAPLVAVVRNAAGNPVQGVSVTFTAPGSGASAVFSNTTNTITATTNASGQVSSGTASANAVTGSYNVTAQATGGTSPLTTFSVGNQPPTQLSINDVFTTEGDSGTKTLTFTVTASPVNNVATVNVNYATANGTATAGSDYTSASGTLTFAPNVATQTVSITVQGDTLFEANETFFVNLSNAFNATISDGQGGGTITDDDAPAAIAVVSGNSQLAETTRGFAAPLVAVVENAAGNPVQGVSVVFTAPASGASTVFSATGTNTLTVVTNASGQASSGVFSANGTPGLYTVTAQAAGGTAPSTTFSLGNQPPTQLSINDVSITEGDAGTQTLTFTVTASPVNTVATVTAGWATVNNTASSTDGDFVAASGTLIFAPGVATQTLGITINGDTKFENTESFFVNLSPPTNASLAQPSGLGTITNDDALPTLAINDVTMPEEAGIMTFTVTRTGATALPISVTYATADGTAVSTAGGPGTPDFTATSGTMNFGASTAATLTQTFTVNLTNDSVYEAAEQFLANLSGATGATIVDSQGVGTIISDDPAPTLSINDVTASEGGSATFTVTLSGATALPIAVNFATADGTAVSTNGGPGTPDYTATSGTLTFNPSAASSQTLTITVPLANDTTAEPAEQFALNLSGPTNGATLTDAQGVATIVDDDPVPNLSINDVTLAEGNSGTTAFAFTVALSASSAQTITVNYATLDGTALAGSDYSAASGTLTFAPGVTSQTVTVQVTGDTVFEANQTFLVNLSGATNTVITDGQGVGTITNDDAAPTLRINDVTGSEHDGPLTFTVTLSGPTALPISVDYITVDGTAVSDATAAPGTPDYTPASGTLNFAPSASATQTQTFTVPVFDDSTLEPTEQFAVNLSGATNGATISDAQGIGTITNDDLAPSLSIANAQVAEGNTGTAALSFTVTLSAVSGTTATVNYATADGTATTADNDYAATSGTLTFAPGVTTQTVTVLITGDTVVEPTETFTVQLSAATNAALGTASATGTITNDDAPVVTTNTLVIAQAEPTLTINGSSFDPTPANNVVAFNFGAAGTVTAATATSLTVGFTTPPTRGGALTAVVTISGTSSGAPVQVATVDAIPDVQDDVAYVQKKSAVEIDVLANDTDSGGDTLTITGVSTPVHGTATIIENGGKIRYETTESKVAPDTFTYTVTDSHNTTATAHVTVTDQVPAQAGTYNGLIQPAIGTTVENARAGLVKITTNRSTGKFTAALKLAGQSFTATGSFDSDGLAKFGKTNAPDFAVKRKNASELRLTLQLGLDPVIEKIEGTLTDGGAPFAVIQAERALYTAAKNPVAPYLALPPGLAGKYTVRLAALAAPNQGHQATEYPQGDGVGVLTLSTAGVAKLTGTLADGTNFSYANSISRAKYWPFYVPVAKGAGSVSGTVTFQDQATTHSDLDGIGLQWFLPPNEKAVRYPQGWADGIAIDLLGSALVLPSTKSGESVLTLANGPQPAGNVALQLTGGGLVNPGVEQAFNLTGKAAATAVLPNPTKATLSVPRTGYFSGAFQFPGTNKPGKYKGIIFQNTSLGYGFFLGTEETGSVSLGDH